MHILLQTCSKLNYDSNLSKENGEEFFYILDTSSGSSASESSGTFFLYICRYGGTQELPKDTQISWKIFPCRKIHRHQKSTRKNKY